MKSTRKQGCSTITNIARRKTFCVNIHSLHWKLFVLVLSTIPWIFSICNSWRHCIQSEADTQPAWFHCWPGLILQTTWGRLTEYGKWLIRVLSGTYNYSFIIMLHIKEKLLNEMIWNYNLLMRENAGQSKLYLNIIPANFAELWLSHNIC